MITTFIAALIVGLLAPVVRGKSWGVPFSLLSIGMVLASFVGSLLTVLIVGAVAGLLLRTTNLTPDQIDLAAGGIGGFGGLLLLWTSARRMRDIRGLSILCQRVLEEDARPTALQALDRLLTRVKKRNPERHVALVLMATGPLTQASLWQEARQWLSRLDEETLSAEQAVLRDQALATCLLQFDEIDAAQEAIDRISRPTEPSIEVWLVAMEALVLALRGRYDAAESELAAQDTSNNPSLDASHRLVRAHIMAGREQRSAALEELKALRQVAGEAGLLRALHPRGPASALARELIDTEEAKPASP